MSIFRKYKQNFVAVKNLAAAKHFPLKIPQISFIKGKIPFLRNHAKSINSSQHRHRGPKFGMNHPYKCPQKVIFPIFDILSGCHFIEGNSLEKGKKGENGGKKRDYFYIP